MVGAEAHHDLATLRPALAGLGYEDMGEAGVPGRCYLRRRGKTDFNIALVRIGGPLWIANLALRGYLRTNPAAAAEYADGKQAAWESGARTLLPYSDRKSTIMRRLIEQANLSNG
jgi:GrpB-like predicted nucleotidyltransferase (UPF0157 family)